jgi:GLPGLI family protein
MKKSLFLFLFLFLFSFKFVNISSSQTYCIYYVEQNKLNLDIVENEVIPVKFRADLKEMLIQESKAKYYFKLIYDKGKSMYSFDKIVDKPKNMNSGYVDIYKDFMKQEIYITGGLMPPSEAIKENFPKWTYQKETKKILNYTCQKAILIEEKNDTTTAWYTTEIPIMEGPNVYAGLPGLILEIDTKTQHFKISEIEKIENKNFSIEIPNFEKFITKEDYKRVMLSGMKK